MSDETKEKKPPPLWDGFSRISFEEFFAVLRETIGARDCWPRFQNNPVSYCQSRIPIEQGYALFQLATEKGKNSRKHGEAQGVPPPRGD